MSNKTIHNNLEICAKLNRIEDKVEQILVDHKDARNSDKILISRYAEEYLYKKNKITVGEYIGFSKVLMMLPSTESIRRSRQRIQETVPYLQADEMTNKERRKLEGGYIEYDLQGKK